MKSARLIAAMVASVVLALASPSFGQVSWDDGAGAANEWNASGFANWSGNLNPAGMGVTFGDMGTNMTAGTTTNILDTDYTINSLTFNHSNGQFHTTDLAGNTLEVSGNLLLGVSASSATLAHANIARGAVGGTLRVLGNTLIGHPSGRVGRLDVTGGVAATYGDSTVSDIFGIGDRTLGIASGPLTTGTYTQDGGTLSITASRVTVGEGPNGNDNNPGNGAMMLTNMNSTSIVTGGNMVVGGSIGNARGVFSHTGSGAGSTFSADIGGDLRINSWGNAGLNNDSFTVSNVGSATLDVAGGLYIFDDNGGNNSVSGSGIQVSTVTLPTTDVTIGDGAGANDRLLIGVGGNRSTGRYTQTGGTLAIDVVDIQLGVGGGGNQGAFGILEATGMTTTSIVTSGDFIVGNANQGNGNNPNGWPGEVTAIFAAGGGTMSGSVGGNLDIMASGGQTTTPKSSTLDLSGTTFTPDGFHIAGAMRVGLVARGTARLGDGSNPDPLAADVTAGALAVGGAGSNDIGLVELHGTRFAVDGVGGLNLGPNGSIDLFYDATSAFDPADAWLRVPLADGAALQSLIDLDQIQAFVDDGSGFTQQDEFMGDTFGVFSNTEFAFAAFALPQSAVPEPTSLALWSVLGLVGLLTARRFRRGR